MQALADGVVQAMFQTKVKAVAAAVLVGLLGNALFGLWWLDPAAALVVAGVALREGRQSWRGEGCCDAC